MTKPLTWQMAKDNLWAMRDEIWQALIETGIMLGISTVVSVICGLIIGVNLFLTSKNQLLTNHYLYSVISTLTNLIRAFPFVILVIALIPLTRIVANTNIGPVAASFPLSIAGAFYFARLVEQNLRDIPKGIIEAGQAMGASTTIITIKILLVESRSSLILSITTLIIGILSYSAAAGMIGGGGLGDFAIRYGYYRYQNEVMIFTVILLIFIVIIIQGIGNFLAHKLDKR